MEAKDDKRKKLRRIEIKTRKLSNQVFAGSYHSAFKGRGMSFSEVREYQFGDDVRSIDWNVTARTGHPFIKVFEEERELTVILLIDASRSTYFGTQTEFKSELIASIASVLSFSAIKNSDKVGAIFFTNTVESYIPPKKGKSHILRIINDILDFQPKGNGSNIREALRYFNNVIKKKSIAFLISDFMDVGYTDALNIASRRHDLIGLHLYDKRERELPADTLLQVRDAESGKEFWVDTSDKHLLRQYTELFDQRLRTTKENFGRAGAQLESMSTEDNYVNVLRKMFKKREVKR